MICKNCNYEADRDFTFCPKCGAKNEPEQPQVNVEETTVLEPADEPVLEPSTEEKSAEAMPNAKKKKWPIITAIIAAIVLVLGALSWVFLPRIEMMIFGKGGYYLKQELSTFERYDDIAEVSKEVAKESSISGDLKITASGSSIPVESQEMLDKFAVSVDLQTNPDSEKSYEKIDINYDGESIFNILVQADGEKSALSLPYYDENKQIVTKNFQTDASLSENISKTLDVDEDVIKELSNAIVKQALPAILEAEDAEVGSDEFNDISCTTITFEITEDSIKALLDELKTIVEDDENFETFLEAFYNYSKENNLLETEEKFDFDEISKDIIDSLDDMSDDLKLDEDITYTVYIENGLFSRGDVLSRVVKINDEELEINTYEEGATHFIELIAEANGDDKTKIAVEYTTENSQLEGKVLVEADGDKGIDGTFKFKDETDFEIKADIGDGEGSFVYKASKDGDKVDLLIEVVADDTTVSLGGELKYSDKADSIDIDINDESNLSSEDIQTAFQNIVYSIVGHPDASFDPYAEDYDYDYSYDDYNDYDYNVDDYDYSYDDYDYDDYDYNVDDYDYSYDDYDDYDYNVDDYDYSDYDAYSEDIF